MNSQKKLYLLMLLLLAQAKITYTLGEAVPYELLKELLPSNAVVIEAGAQFGEDTEWMSAFWPQGTIYAFEPSPASFLSVQAVADKYSKRHLVNLISVSCARSELVEEYLSSAQRNPSRSSKRAQKQEFKIGSL